MQSKTSKLIQLLFVLVIESAVAFSVFANSDSSERTVKLRIVSEVSSDTVCLNDLVEELWVQQRCSLQKEDCCRFSLNGAKRTQFTRREIQENFPAKMFKGVVLNFSPEITDVDVVRTKRELTEAEILSELTKNLINKYSIDEKQLKIINFKTHAPIYVGYEIDKNWQLILPERLTKDQLVRVVKTGTEEPIGWLTAQIAVLKKVYVSKNTIRPGELLSEEMFNLEIRDILTTSQGGDLVASDHFPVGAKAKLSIFQGKALTASVIEKKPMVRFGDIVTIALKSDNLKITTKGIAQGIAGVGDQILVQVQKYNKTFKGELKEGKIVEVSL